MPDVAIGPDRDGDEIRLAAGERALLRLPENPTTGVRWSVERIDGPLVVVGDDFEPQHDAAVGAAGVRVLTLQRTGPGPAALALVCGQAWEGPESVIARFACRFPA